MEKQRKREKQESEKTREGLKRKERKRVKGTVTSDSYFRVFIFALNIFLFGVNRIILVCLRFGLWSKKGWFVIVLLYLVVWGRSLVRCWGNRGRNDDRWIPLVDGGGGSEGIGLLEKCMVVERWDHGDRGRSFL